MELLNFHKMRTAVQQNASPGPAEELARIEENLRAELMASGLFESVEAEFTDNPDGLVIALCQFRPDLTETEVAAELERLWQDRVRYSFWAAHALLVDEEHVELEAATRAGDEGHYVTVHLVAQKARIPLQRAASE